MVVLELNGIHINFLFPTLLDKEHGQERRQWGPGETALICTPYLVIYRFVRAILPIVLDVSEMSHICSMHAKVDLKGKLILNK